LDRLGGLDGEPRRLADEGTYANVCRHGRAGCGACPVASRQPAAKGPERIKTAAARAPEQ